MLKIEVIDWPELRQNGKYIFINPHFILYIMPYDYNIQNGLYKLTMCNSSEFIIEQSGLDKILECKGDN